MSLPNLDMDALRTLLAVHQLGSLHRAADSIARSQSAVSQQMRKLEEQIGLPLFRRKGRKLALTEAGELVLSYARRILSLNDEAVYAARGTSIDGIVRFGLPEDFADTWLTAALGQFKKNHPAVQVQVAVERNGMLLERLDRGELDLVLAMGYEGRADAHTLATLQMAWIGPAGMKAVPAAQGPLDLALYPLPCLFRRAGIEALDKANISWRAAYTTGSLHSLWSGVEAGLGITLRTLIGLPPSLRQLGAKEGLPPLPSVALCLHDGQGDSAQAVSQLKQVVMQSATSGLR